MYNRQAVTHGRICKCRTCGMAFTNPQFPPEEYSRIYLSASKRGPTTEKAVVSDATRFRKLSRIVLKYSPAKGRLLDFGCGSGQFLHTLTNHEYVGFDLTTLGEHSAFNSRVLTGEFLDMLGRAPLDYQSFDIITAWDVIEHLPYLTEYTEGIASLIKPGGYLFVTLPNIKSLSARLFGRRWNAILLEHLWYFTPDSLTRFMAEFGLYRVALGGIWYTTQLSHLVNRLAQTCGLGSANLKGLVGRLTVSLPIGLMYGVFRKADTR
jgi:2-polyprenyl-3-methyl-5-hydroxy-6-metoxy-1,4-benzoquinol methylase